jgi:hypothetical protein
MDLNGLTGILCLYVFGAVNSMSSIWNDNMREKREANANATWRVLIRDRPRVDGV